MRDYAVTLEFDRESAQKMQKMIDGVASATGCDFMVKFGVPPHVTVSAIVCDDEERLISETEATAETLNKGDISFANIGIFNPFVIYLGPVMDEFLMNTCKTVNDRLLTFCDVGNRGRYLPWQWVPHAAIAVKLTPDALNTAFDIVRDKFAPFGAAAERLVLARAEPYEELRSWELK